MGDDPIFPYIPTIDEPMSTFTYAALCALISGIGVGTAALVWWIRKEISRIEERMYQHEIFISDTSGTIAQMSTDIAVTREAVENIEAAVKETKTSIAEINRILLDGRNT